MATDLLRALPTLLLVRCKLEPWQNWDRDDESGRVVGRIMKHPQAPKDQPWLWAIIEGISPSIDNRGYAAWRLSKRGSSKLPKTSSDKAVDTLPERNSDFDYKIHDYRRARLIRIFETTNTDNPLLLRHLRGSCHHGFSSAHH